MTVIYTEDLATAQDFSVFWRILGLWKGSIYKMIWPNMILYVASYCLLSLTYRTMMTDDQRANFELLVMYCRHNTDKIKVPFFLGFFVTEVYNRWWNQFFTLAWPDACTISLACNMDGMDRKTRSLKRQIIRYCDLSFALLMRVISPPVADRLKRRAKLVEHGMMTEDEANEMRRLRLDDEYRPHYVVPLQWAAILAANARKNNSIETEEQLCQFLDTLSSYTDALINTWLYNWINLPVSYTQLVTLVVYVYYFAQILAQQYLNPKNDCLHADFDYYIPMYLFTQYFFFMGWLKTAEQLINPFGEDDDDLDVNWLIDRHFEYSCLACDHLQSEEPKAMFDWYWSQKFPDEVLEEERKKRLAEELAIKKLEEQETQLRQAQIEENEMIYQLQRKESELRRLAKSQHKLKTEATAVNKDLLEAIISSSESDDDDELAEKGEGEDENLPLPPFTVDDLMYSSDVEEVQASLSSPGKYSSTKGFLGLFGSMNKHLEFLKNIRKSSKQRAFPTSNEDLQNLESLASLSDADLDKILGSSADAEEDEEPPLITLADAAEYFNMEQTTVESEEEED